MKIDLDGAGRFVIVVTLCITLMGIVGVILHSLVWVTQPMIGMSPMDAEFFKLLAPIATFITGSLGTMLAMGKGKASKDEGEKDAG
jgi:hypothetical protein